MGKIKKLKKEIELLKEIRDLYREIEEIKAREWKRVFNPWPYYFTTTPSTTYPIFTTNSDNTINLSQNQL